MLGVKIIKPGNERKDQNALSKRVITECKNSWIDIKRFELSQKMESLVPFLRDGFGVEIQFRGVLRDRSEPFYVDGGRYFYVDSGTYVYVDSGRYFYVDSGR